MIRSVAYSKAVLAGMAGAIAWEIVARVLIWAGVPFFDLVVTLGTVVLPHASPWAVVAVGMLLHLVVGAIWAVFYAYFFWSVLPLRPALQGLVFAFVPMPLAIFIMHPQLDLMHPLVQSRPLSSSGLFGLSGGLHEPLSIAVGHLIWGAVLGLLYTHPVGFPANRPPRLRSRLADHARSVASPPEPADRPVHVRHRHRVQLSDPRGRAVAHGPDGGLRPLSPLAHRPRARPGSRPSLSALRPAPAPDPSRSRPV